MAYLKKSDLFTLNERQPLDEYYKPACVCRSSVTAGAPACCPACCRGYAPPPRTMPLPTRHAPPPTGYMCTPLSTLALGWKGGLPRRQRGAYCAPPPWRLAGAGGCTHCCFAQYRVHIQDLQPMSYRLRIQER